VTIHKPVLLNQVISGISPLSGKIVVDATFGGGGHSVALAQEGAIVFSIDKDPLAIEEGERLLNQIACSGSKPHSLDPASFSFPSGGKIKLASGQFSQIQKMAADFLPADAVLFDLGISSDQLSSKRGFSFGKDGPLDMRYNPDIQKVTAADLLKILSQNQLYEILTQFSQEKHARAIAKAIVRQRSLKPIETTLELSSLVSSIVPGGKIHPATRTFMALRIAVNSEFEELQEGLNQAYLAIKSGGKILAISFHSGEDRIIKNFVRSHNLIPFKLIRPEQNEISQNPRARSAKLRIFVKP